MNVLDSMFFGGISGSAVADVSSLGTIVIPMMVKQGYDEGFLRRPDCYHSLSGVCITRRATTWSSALGGGRRRTWHAVHGGSAAGHSAGLWHDHHVHAMAKRYHLPRWG